MLHERAREAREQEHAARALVLACARSSRSCIALALLIFILPYHNGRRDSSMKVVSLKGVNFLSLSYLSVFWAKRHYTKLRGPQVSQSMTVKCFPR